MRLKSMRRTKFNMRFVSDRRGVESGGEAGCSIFARLGEDCTLTSETERLVEHRTEAWMADLAGSRTCVEVRDIFAMTGRSEVETMRFV